MFGGLWVDFCFNCGATIPAGSEKCPKCGSAVWNKTKDKENVGFPIGGLIISIILSVAIIIVTVILSKGYGAYRPEKAVEKYMKAYYEDFDAKRAETLWHKELVKFWCEEDDMTLDEYFDESQDYLDDYQDRLDEDNAKIKWEVVDIDDAKKSDLEDIQDWYEDEHNLKVKDMKIVEVDIEYEDDTDDFETTFEFYVVKIGAKWYIDELY